MLPIKGISCVQAGAMAEAVFLADLPIVFVMHCLAVDNQPAGQVILQPDMRFQEYPSLHVCVPCYHWLKDVQIQSKTLGLGSC